MRDRYVINEKTMRRLIASLEETTDQDVSRLQRIVATLCGLEPHEMRSSPSSGKRPVRRTG